MKILLSLNYINKLAKVNITEEQLKNIRYWIMNGVNANKAIENTFGAGFLSDMEKEEIREILGLKRRKNRIPALSLYEQRKR